MAARQYRPRGLEGESLLAHIFATAQRSPSGCLEWQGRRHEQGYGQITYQGKLWKVHRLVLHLLGKLPPGQDSLHSCDNPPCCDPEHLHAGTHKQNMEEKALRSRTAKTHRGKLTDHREAILADQRPSRAIARDYGVTHRAILQLKRKIT